MLVYKTEAHKKGSAHFFIHYPFLNPDAHICGNNNQALRFIVLFFTPRTSNTYHVKAGGDIVNCICLVIR